MLSAMGVKEEEEVITPSCSSVHLGGWSGSLDGEYCTVSPAVGLLFSLHIKGGISHSGLIIVKC